MHLKHHEVLDYAEILRQFVSFELHVGYYNKYLETLHLRC